MSHGFIELNLDVEPSTTMAVALHLVHICSVEQLPAGGCEIITRAGDEYRVVNSYGDVMNRIRQARETRAFANGRPAYQAPVPPVPGSL